MSVKAMEDVASNTTVASDCKATAIALELADSVHFLFDTLSALPQAALILNKSGKIKYLNDNMLRLLAKEQKDCLTHPFDSTLLDSFSPDLTRQLLNAVTAVEKNQAKRTLISGKRQGKPFTGEMTVQKLTSTTGELRGILLLLEEYSMVAPRDESRTVAPSTDDKEMVTAGIAHQLRNNLQSLQSIIELLVMGTSGAFLPEEYVAMLRQELSESDYMLTEMLNLSRWQKIDLKEVAINDFCQDIVKLVRASVILKPITIEEHYEANMPVFRLDVFRLKQVLLNILHNALDAIGDKGTVTVTTGFDPQAKLGKIEIQDTGGGMDAETLEKIRRPFFTTKEKGHGLGLLVCRRLLADQGAYLNINSQQGKGSTFSIMLPLV